MSESKRQKFRLVDAMILIVAIAISFAWVKYVNNKSFPGSIRFPFSQYSLVEKVIHDVQDQDVFVLFPLMVALAIIGLRSLTRDERLVRPGIMALLVGIIAGFTSASASLTNSIYYTYTDEWEFQAPSSVSSYDGYTLAVRIWSDSRVMGISIALVWLYMRLSHRWVAQKDWLDRTGRVIGFYWIIASILPKV